MHETMKSLFERYKDDTVIMKSEGYAYWTLPQLMIDLQIASNGTTQQLERDFQEMGALLVNNLASKLAALLFPSSRPFYKIKLSAAVKRLMKYKGTKERDVATGLSKLEMESCQQLFLNASYEQLVMALKHLIVTGNVLLYRDSKKFTTHAYGLRSFGIRRDGRGNMMDCVLREYTAWDSLSPDIQMILATKQRAKYTNLQTKHNKVELYTRIQRITAPNGNIMYEVSQEADDVPVGTSGTYPEHLCPWQAPTWSLVAGENYGRGLVEDYGGGFAKLSDASHASTLYGIEMSKVVHLVAPGQGADIDALQQSENGEYIQGTKDAVTAYEGGDAKKFEQMEAAIAATFGRLARAFMYKANTRDAERVTAYELKQDALEAENTLGGVYSSLSAAMQIPLAHVLLLEVDPGSLVGIVTKDMKLDIIAGIPALGRQADVQNLAAASQEAAAIVPVLKQLSPKIDVDKIMAVIFAAHSIDPDSVYMDEDQIAELEEGQRQEAAGQAQIAQTTTTADQAAQLTALQG